jgi:hypothetical protein
MVKLSKKGVSPTVLIDLFRDVAIEVAVGALGHTERPVDIDPKRPAAGDVG